MVATSCMWLLSTGLKIFSTEKNVKYPFFFFQWLHIAIGFLYTGYLHTGLNKYIKSTCICLVLLLKFKVLSVAHTIFDGKR